MKVSVIIPTYNRAQYLSGAIDSVLAQTHPEIELIVVDDGSTDNTQDILSKYEGNIVCQYITNSGPAVARNVGMEMASGEYVAYLDSDDLYYPFKIALQVDFLDCYKDAGMVYTEFSGFDDNGYFDYRHLKNYHRSAYQTGALSYNHIFSKRFAVGDYHRDENLSSEMTYMGEIFDAYLLNTVVFTNSMMFRKSILQKTGLQDVQFGYFHDLEFALRICKYYPVGFIDVPTYKLRYHPDQVSTLASSNRSQVAVQLQSDLLKVTEFHGKQDNNYYAANKNKIDRQLARLSRAVAVPLMGYNGNDTQAREYLEKCRLYGHPEYLLWGLSYMPHFIRRIVFKFLTIRKTINTRLRLLIRAEK